MHIWWRLVLSYRTHISVSQTTIYTLKLTTAILSNGLVAAWQWKSHSTIRPNPRDPYQDSWWGRSSSCNQEVRVALAARILFFTLFVFTSYLTFILSGLWLIILGSTRACERITIRDENMARWYSAIYRFTLTPQRMRMIVEAFKDSLELGLEKDSQIVVSIELCTMSWSVAVESQTALRWF